MDHDYVQFYYNKNGQIVMEGHYKQADSHLNQDFRYALDENEVPDSIKEEAKDNTLDEE